MADEGSSRNQISAGFIGIAVIAVLLVVFIFQNTQDETVKLLLWEFTAPMWLVLAATALVTLVLAEIATFLRRRRR